MSLRTNTIGAKLKEQSAKDTTQSDKSQALVVRSGAELNKAVSVHFPRLSYTSSRKRIWDYGAYGAGQRAGRGVTLRQGISGGSQSGGGLLT